MTGMNRTMVMFRVALFLVSCNLALGICQDGSTLQLSQVLYRHGDRTTLHSYPTDPNLEYWEKLGYGRLTKIGMQQHYQLGQFLRRRYTGFLSTLYSYSEIVIRSTNVDRTLMSAECDLAGLYPPTGDQVWDADLLWQPIPIHTIPEDGDHLLNTDAVCPLAEKIVRDALNSSEAREQLNKYKELFEYLSNKTGNVVSTFGGGASLHECILIEKLYNLTIPSWVDPVYEQLYQLSLLDWAYTFPGSEAKRLRGGPLLGEMISNINKTISEGNQMKMYMYSAHDTTIAAFLSTLDLWDGTQPPYRAAVLVELYEMDGEHYVQISYRNSTDVEPYILTVPGCTELCLFSTFQTLAQIHIPQDVEKECQI